MVLGSFCVDVRSHDLDQAFRGQLGKYNDQINPPDGGEDLRSLIGRQNRTALSLQRRDGSVVVKADHQKVAKRGARLQKRCVAVMNQIETAVRKDDRL